MVSFLFVLLVIIVYYITRDIFHPGFIMVFFWTIAYIIISLFPGFYTPSMYSEAIVFIYIAEFAFFTVLTGIFLGLKKEHPIILKNSNNKILITLSVVFTVLLLYYIWQHIIVMLSFGSLRAYFFYVRNAEVHHGIKLVKSFIFMDNIKTYASVLSVVVVYKILNNEFKGIIKLYLYIFVLITLFSSIMEGARSNFVIYFFSYIALYVYLKGIKAGIKAILIFLTIFFVISMYTRCSEMLNNNFFVALKAYLYHIIMYAFASTITFGTFLNSNINAYSEIAVKIVNKINSISNLLGGQNLLYHPTKVQLPFAPVSDNMVSNVYSFLAVYITYFGFLGTAAVIMIHGIIITLIYRLGKKHILFFFLYTLMIPTIILSLFYEYFFSLSPHYIRMIIVVCLLYYIKFPKLLKTKGELCKK